MVWSAPMTAVANTTFTAAQFNTYLRDNLLETAPAKATTAGRIFVTTGANAIAERQIAETTINTLESSSSTAYVNLATVGPSVTVTTGTQAIVLATAWMGNTTGGAGTYYSFEIVSGGVTAATDDRAFYYESSNAGDGIRACSAEYVTGLTAGSSTFHAKYRVTTGSGSWQDRKLLVIAL